MADVIKTIGATGADYTTLAAFWTARNTNAGAGDVYIGELIDNADYPWGEVTGTFAGSVKIRPATSRKLDLTNPTAPHAKITGSGSVSALYYRSLAPLTIEDLEVASTSTSAVCLRLGAFEDTNVTVQRCLVRGGSTGISHGRATATTLVENCVVTGPQTWGINNGFAGITVRKTVVVGCNVSNTASRGGMRKDIAGAVIDNVVCYGNGLVDFFGASTTSTVSYLASGDTSATGANALTGVTSAAFTNYAGQVYTAANGGVLDGSAAGGADRGLNLSVADVIAITSQYGWSFFQRSALINSANIPVSGTYSGGTVPTSIEARWNGGAWNVIDAAPSGGAFSGTLTNQPCGNGILEVRYSNATTVTDSVDDVAIGAKFLFWGQSNFSGRATNPQTYTGPAGFFHKYTVSNNLWQQGGDPFDEDTANGSIFPLLANYLVAHLGVPVAFIGVAEGSTTLSQWQSGQTLNTRMLNYISAAASDGLEGICSWIGESDAGNATSETTYKTQYNAVIDQLKTLTGVNSMLVAISGLALTDYANVRQWIKDIAATSANVSDTVPEMWPLYQKIHYETDTETALAADAVFDGIVASFYTTGVQSTVNYDIGEIAFAVSASASVPVVDAVVSYDIGAVEFSASASSSVPVFQSDIAYDIGAIEFNIQAAATAAGNFATIAYDIGAIDFSVSADSSVPVVSATASYDIGEVSFSIAAAASVPVSAATVSFDIGEIVFAVSASSAGPAPQDVSANISYDIGEISFAVSARVISLNPMAGVGAGIQFKEPSRGVQF